MLILRCGLSVDDTIYDRKSLMKYQLHALNNPTVFAWTMLIMLVCFALLALVYLAFSKSEEANLNLIVEQELELEQLRRLCGVS